MKLGRSIKYIFEIMLLLLVIFLCFLWWSFSTSSGTKSILAATQNRLQNINYEYESGSLLDGIVLKEANWQLKNGTAIHGKDLQITATPSCWKNKEICIDSGVIEQLKINLPITETVSDEITLKDLSLLLSIKANGITVKELLVTHPNRPPIVFNNANFSASISESEITLKHFTTEWNKLHLNGSGTLTMQNHYPINMTGTASRALGADVLLTEWSTGGNLKSLQLDAQFSKPFKANLNGTIALLDRRRPADMKLSWDNIALPFKAKKPGISFTDGNINITGTWPQYTTQGTANLDGPDIPPGRANLNGYISTSKLSFKPLTIDTLNGRIVSDGEFSWMQGMRWQANVESENLQPQVQWPELNGLIDASATISGMIGKQSSELRFNTINAKGTLNDLPVTLTGDLSKNTDQNWRIENLQLKSDSNNASANGTIGESIKLLFSMDSLEKLIPGAIGNLNGDVTVTGDIKSPTVEGSVTTAKFQYNDINLRNARINGIVRNLGADHSDIKIQAHSVQFTDRLIKQPDLTFYGSLSDHRLNIKLKSDPLDSVSIAINGALDEHKNWNGKISSAKGTMANRLLSLVNPITATWVNENKTLAVAPHCWTYEFASVCVEKHALIGKTGVVQFALNRLPLESIKDFIPETVELGGNLRSNGNLTWGPNSNTTVTVNSHLEEATATINKTINNKKLNLAFPVAQLKISTEGQKIRTQLRMKSDRFSTLSADVEINTANTSLPIRGTANLNESQLSWIKEFLPDIKKLDGKLSGDATISGTLANPVLNGVIRLKDGYASSSLAPVDVNKINLVASVSENRAEISGTAMANNSKINITGSGSVDEDGISSDINLIGNGIDIQHEYARNATLSPDLNFKIRPRRIDIYGNVDIPSARVTYQVPNVTGIALSDDVVITDDKDIEIPTTRVGSTGVNTRIRISLGNDVSVEAYGLNADLSGAFQFALESEKPPTLAGTIAVTNGDYNAYGQKLKIRDGEITFTGPIEQTALSVEAIRETKDLLAGVRIKGTLTNPTTSLFSEPPVNEADILPYIVLGRKLDLNESDDDTGLLQKAALMLGIDQGQKISKGLARSLGIDDFSLSAWGTGDDTQILVSGKLSEKLLLRYGVGVFKNNNSLYLRYDLAEKFYLETTHGLDSAVDVFYSFDF